MSRPANQPINPEVLRFLVTEEGESAVLEAGEQLPGHSAQDNLLARLTRLRKRLPLELASAAIEQADLRKRGHRKFGSADRMLFTRRGLEQSSGERAAAWRAAQFRPGSDILDLCCGIGGDAIALGKTGNVVAVDIDPGTANCARVNLEVHRVSAPVGCADATRVRLRADAAFFDPSRREGDRRVRSAEDYTPPLSFTNEILRSIPDLAVKVSPAISDEPLDELQRLGARVEFISDRGECKEAVLWFGSIGPESSRSASIIDCGASLSFDPIAVGEIGPMSEWLLEPDPAAIRAGLVDTLSIQTGARRLDPALAYLTSDLDPASPFVTCYRVIDEMPFNVKSMRAFLRSNGLLVTTVKKRGVPLEPEEMVRKLDVGSGNPCVLVLFRIGGTVRAVVCEPLEVR